VNPLTKESKNHLDLVVVEIHNMEEAISDDSVLNHSSTPPHAVEPIQAQAIRTLSLFSFSFAPFLYCVWLLRI
jgi:hypothetical protein